MKRVEEIMCYLFLFSLVFSGLFVLYVKFFFNCWFPTVSELFRILIMVSVSVAYNLVYVSPADGVLTFER